MVFAPIAPAPRSKPFRDSRPSVFLLLRQRVTTRFFAWLLTGVLLLAQMLGLLHGVEHGPQAHSRLQYQAAPRAQPGAGAHTTGQEKTWLAALFRLHQADTDCRLFDQASHGSAAPGIASLSMPMALTAAVLGLSLGLVLARWAALYEARGPPPAR